MERSWSGESSPRLLPRGDAKSDGGFRHVDKGAASRQGRGTGARERECVSGGLSVSVGSPVPTGEGSPGGRFPPSLARLLEETPILSFGHATRTEHLARPNYAI
ncbi:MAG: hypothetical protein KME30_13620 [Iphinoe sp. HA4291-MV1]|jgi:hypothetical protein|nr:hypothetical protein [Iphinoe sp. HA4291-MV1]